MSKPKSKDKKLAQKVRKLGCKPRWYDGILGWAYHCNCDDNKHGCDQQCSAIVEKK